MSVFKKLGQKFTDYLCANPAGAVVLMVYGVFGAVCLAYLMYMIITDDTISCFYFDKFNIQCPGCGLTRMFKSMMKLHFAEAFKYNPVMFCLFFFWNTVSIGCLVKKPNFFKNPVFLIVAMIVSLTAVVVFTILRNIL